MRESGNPIRIDRRTSDFSIYMKLDTKYPSQTKYVLEEEEVEEDMYNFCFLFPTTSEIPFIYAATQTNLRQLKEPLTFSTCSNLRLPRFRWLGWR